MAMRKGLPAKNAATDANDTRYDFRNLVVCNADASPRPGVTSPYAYTVLYSTASMNVTVSIFSAVAARDSGAVLLSSDGNVNVLLDPAPTSNSRIDVVYAKQNDSSSTVTTPDANDTPVLGIAKGTASASPVKPAIPVGAVDLGSVVVPAGVTATNQDGVVISPPAQFTAAPGAAVPFRTLTDLNLWTTPQPNQLANVFADAVSTNGLYMYVYGTGWRPVGPRVVPVASTKTAGGMPAAAIPIIQSGRVVATTATSGSVPNVLFATPFPTGVATISLTTGSGTAAATVLNADGLRTTGFDAVVGTTSGVAVVFYYLAIGW